MSSIESVLLRPRIHGLGGAAYASVCLVALCRLYTILAESTAHLTAPDKVRTNVIYPFHRGCYACC